MKRLHELLSEIANLLDSAQNKSALLEEESINDRIYQLRCDLEDIREDVQEKIN